MTENKNETETWKTFFEDGCGFHRTAKGGLKRPDVFTPAIIQNIAAMAIEKYFMAVLMKRGLMPFNHTMTDLLQAAEGIVPLSSRLRKTLFYMDELQQICSLDHFEITQPTTGDVADFLEAVNEVAETAQRTLFP